MKEAGQFRLTVNESQDRIIRNNRVHAHLLEPHHIIGTVHDPGADLPVAEMLIPNKLLIHQIQLRMNRVNVNRMFEERPCPPARQTFIRNNPRFQPGQRIPCLH